jgi:D-alanine transaminase
LPDLAAVNGRVTTLRGAIVPLLDRGFLLGDGVYEVLRSYGGRIFQLDAHLDRLEASLAGIELALPMRRSRLAGLLEDLRRRSGYPEARLYVQITRGVAPRQHAFPKRARPTWVVYVEKVPPANPALARNGVAAITLSDPRWSRCDLKTIALLANVLAKQRAVEAGVHEALFVGPDGSVREGSSANVFVIRGRDVWTHPLGPEILPGVSRAVILELARESGLGVRAERFGRRALYAADEVFLSSTMQEVLPIVRIDGRSIGTGRPGPHARALRARFQERAHGTAGPRRRSPRRPAPRRAP